MNYIDLINSFWKTRRTKRLSSNEADLYYFLMQECNLRGWENPFECTNGIICATIGMTEKTLIEVRNRLQQKGLIDYEPGKRKEKSPVYTLLYCKKVSKKDSKTRSINSSKKVGINGSIEGGITPNINIKLNKTKQEKEEREDDFSLSVENLNSVLLPVKKLFEEYKDSSWLETTAMNEKILPDKIGEYFEAFCNLLLSRQDNLKSRQDFCSHFVNWLGIQKKKKLKQHEKQEQTTYNKPIPIG